MIWTTSPCCSLDLSKLCYFLYTKATTLKLIEACYTAHATLCTQVHNQINEIPLHHNENGQYQHDNIVVFIMDVHCQFKSLYNPLQPGQCIADLLEEAPNTLNKIKSTDLAKASIILKKAIAEAAFFLNKLHWLKNHSSKHALMLKTKHTAITMPSKQQLEQTKVPLKPSPKELAHI